MVAWIIKKPPRPQPLYWAPEAWLEKPKGAVKFDTRMDAERAMAVLPGGKLYEAVEAEDDRSG